MTSCQTITIRRPTNGHVHFRKPGTNSAKGQLREDVFDDIVRFTSSVFDQAVVMPNPYPEILTAENWVAYEKKILAASDPKFTPIGTIKLTDDTTPEIIDDAADSGIGIGKYYPIGTTTGSEASGVSNIKLICPALLKMQERNMILSLHCQMPSVALRQAESAFLGIVDWILYTYPKLRIVVEHASTAFTIEKVKRWPMTVAATLTPQHMTKVYDDVFNVDGTMKNPHNYCLPICNSAEDRLAIVRAAISGNPKFIAIDDSAPHYSRFKNCPDPRAGVFSAPVTMPTFTEVFEANDALDRLEDFTSTFFARFYGLPLNEGTITLEKRPWLVPYEYEGIGLWRGGETINWRVA